MKITSHTLRHNKELARIFRQMADCYRYLGPEQRFRAIAYNNASKTLSNLSEPVDAYGHDIKKLDQLKDVGESIATKILEYLDTGNIKTFEELKQKVPFELLELMDIKGIGPATLHILHDTLKVNSKDEIINAIEMGKLHEMKGFGNKKIANLLRVLKINKDEKRRYLLNTAKKTGDQLLADVKGIPAVIRASLAGSIRRNKETIGDIDIVVTAAYSNWKKIINQFIQLPLVKRVLASGETKASVLLKADDMQADIRVVHDDEYGAAMLYFTGSREHNIMLRTIAKKRGWKINEYGVFDVKTNKRLAGETEESIYNLFGLPLIPPEKRFGKEELSILKNFLPDKTR